LGGPEERALSVKKLFVKKLTCLTSGLGGPEERALSVKKLFVKKLTCKKDQGRRPYTCVKRALPLPPPQQYVLLL
jgi:hypothetical protein